MQGIFMIHRYRAYLIFILLLNSSKLFGQVSPSSSMFFINPFYYNASYAGIEGRSMLSLNHRQQWVGIDGAPVTTSLSFHTPLNKGLAVGANIYSDRRSILSTNSFTFSVGYTVGFSEREYLRFGLSGGLGFRNIDLSQVDNPTDPALLDVVENNTFLNGNFGISFQSGYFNVGMSLPNFFEPNLNNVSSFENGDFAPLNEVLFNASYRFYFSLDDMFFEPYLLYRYSQVMPNQFEAAGIFYLKQILWFGGSYRQDYGVSAMIGFSLNKNLLIGYSYGIGTSGLPGIGASTHEFNLSFGFGKKKNLPRNPNPIYISFIDTERIYPDEREQKQKAASQKIAAIKPPPTAYDHDDPRLAMGAAAAKRNVINVKRETVKAGDDEFELRKGSYIIAGDFPMEDFAIQFANKLNDDGYRAEYGFVTEKLQWMVYIYRSDSKMSLSRRVAKFRTNPDLEDIWLLIVE